MITAAPTADQASAPRRHVPTIRRFQRGLAIGDAVVIAIAVVASHLLRFGLTDPELSAGHGIAQLNYLPVGIVLGVVWWWLLASFHTYRERLLGTGTTEYERVLEATLTLFGLVAIGSYMFRVSVSRQYFLMMLPIGVVGLLLWRWLARKLLVRQRRHGRYCHRAVIVGSPASAPVMMEELSHRPEMGIEFVAACLSTAGASEGFEFVPGTSVPVVGDLADVVQAVSDYRADTLVVTAAHDLTPKKIRRIGWSIDPRTQVILAPSVIDVAGPRIHLRPVEGLSLVEIEMPRFDGSKQVLKRGFDILVSSVLIVLLIPCWLVVPMLIWFDDRGPIFFRQVRVGLNGSEFAIWKFRSMKVNADAELAALLKEQGTDGKPLFKVDHDPRITKLGALLRKTSIDELPQLFNVFNGTMSLVGPRPQVPAEVALYDNAAARRLFVKPGVTGLWQVSGRSNLTWEEAVRFDLFYVENWSLTSDIQILFRTVKVVFAREGAG